MDDKDVEIAKSAIRDKGNLYFASHGLAGVLDEAGVESGPDAVCSLVRRLAAEGKYTFLIPISAALRDLSPDDDEFVRIACDMAGRIRYDALQGPLPDILADIGRNRPAAAAGAAARLIGMGDADFAAYMIGGAYAGAASECDGLIEGLFSSRTPEGAAAAVRALRVASAEHGLPGAERVRAAVRRAMVHVDAWVRKEAMEALVVIYRGGDAAAEAMIESMTAAYPEARTVLAAHIWCDSPFDDENSLRHLEACMAGGPEQFVLHSAYHALAKIAGRRPGDVAGMLIQMFDGGWHHSALAGSVLDELGKKGAPAAIAVILEVLQHPRRGVLDERLESAVGRIVRLADLGEVAEAVLRTIDERPAALDASLHVLSLLALENWRRGGGPEFLAGIMSRLCAHPAGTADKARLPGRGAAPSIPA